MQQANKLRFAGAVAAEHDDAVALSDFELFNRKQPAPVGRAP